MESKKRGALPTVLRPLAFLLVAFAYVTGFWRMVSPTHRFYVGLDLSCFYTIGNGMLHGKMPYLDYIDNKGPVTYLIYALIARFGQFPWNAMLLGVVCVFLSLAGLYVLCRRLEIRRYYLVQLFYLILYAAICAGGGVTEDMALPFCIWSFVILADFLRCGADVFRFRYGLCIGLLFWLCALTRINNAVSIAAAAVCIGLRLLFQKRFAHFGKLILSFLVGSAVVLTPITLWLWKRGALKECLDQVLLNNFKYGAAVDAMSKREIFFSGTFALHFYLLLGLCLVLILLCVRAKDDESSFLRRSAWLILALSVLSCLSFTHNYSHYLLCLLPALTFCLTLPFACASRADGAKKISPRSIAAAACCLAVAIGLGGAETFRLGLWYGIDMAVYALKPESRTESWKADWDAVIGHVPDDERDSVLGVEVNPKWFIFSDLEPCRRMFVCPMLFTSISQDYAQEFQSYFQDDPPKWLIVSTELDLSSVAGFEEILTSMYRKADTFCMEGNEVVHLYQLEVGAHA